MATKARTEVKRRENFKLKLNSLFTQTHTHVQSEEIETERKRIESMSKRNG